MFAVILGGPGRRNLRSEVLEYLRKDGSLILMQSSDGYSVAAAVVSGIDILKARAAALKAKKYFAESTSHYVKIGSCANDIQKVQVRCDLRKGSKRRVEKIQGRCSEK